MHIFMTPQGVEMKIFIKVNTIFQLNETEYPKCLTVFPWIFNYMYNVRKQEGAIVLKKLQHLSSCELDTGQADLKQSQTCYPLLNSIM